MTQALHDWLARYRLPLSFFLFLALVFEWQLNDGGRPHALLDPRHLTPWLGLMLIATGLLRFFAVVLYHIHTVGLRRMILPPEDWCWWRGRGHVDSAFVQRGVHQLAL